jgi:hypothetical protein
MHAFRNLTHFVNFGEKGFISKEWLVFKDWGATFLEVVLHPWECAFALPLLLVLIAFVFNEAFNEIYYSTSTKLDSIFNFPFSLVFCHAFDFFIAIIRTIPEKLLHLLIFNFSKSWLWNNVFFFCILVTH